SAVGLAGMLFRGGGRPTIAIGGVLLDLIVATYGDNPPARPGDVYPITGAIHLLHQAPHAPPTAGTGGWGLSRTPSDHGIEDIKTTDPVQHLNYMRLLKGYLHIDPDSYDLLIQDYSQPFFDHLNIRYIYVPPNQPLTDPRFVERYRGPDGIILENTRALP